jgi:hypothetical protein
MNVVQKGAWQGRLQLPAVALTVCDLVIVLLAYFVQKDPWYDLIWIVIFTIILPVVGLLLFKNKLWVGAILLGIAFVCQLVLTVLSASSFGDGLAVIDVLLILGVAIAVFGLMSLVQAIRTSKSVTA